ncbi:uncharacterized protein [Halyomorpha halys]|uniref:uncharacterized protein n=1 Tax=Halyomorpha halys TaxID=286706 RepID=UPI0006D50642|nr:uncharacterized protein LOC106692796 [Halyomorpha halys]
MKNYKFIIDLLIFLVVNDACLTLAVDKSYSKSFPLNNTSNKDSHEEFHSKIDPSTVLHPLNNSVNVINIHPKDHSNNNSLSHHQLDDKILKKTDVPVNSSSLIESTPKHEKVVIAEGGVEVSSQYPLKNKTNETNLTMTTVSIVTPHPSITTKMVDLPVNLTTPGVNTTQIHKRIHGRPGVSEIVTPTTTNKPSSTTTTSRPRKKKPLFTMITGDKETKDSESFIESPTTGRDYVLPIVLIILSLPIVGYLIKIIYRRGTEFTERQQYHRMYLIDGMYNSR